MFCQQIFSQECEMGWQPAHSGAEERARAGSPRRAWSAQLRAALLWQPLLSPLLGKAVCGLTGIKEIWVLSPLCSDYSPKIINSLGAGGSAQLLPIPLEYLHTLGSFSRLTQSVCLQLPALQAHYSVKISHEFLHLWLMCKVKEVPVIFREDIKSLKRM